MKFKLIWSEGGSDGPDEQSTYIDVAKWRQLSDVLWETPNIGKWVDVYYKGEYAGIAYPRHDFFLMLPSFPRGIQGLQDFFDPDDNWEEEFLPPPSNVKRTNPYLEIL